MKPKSSGGSDFLFLLRYARAQSALAVAAVLCLLLSALAGVGSARALGELVQRAIVERQIVWAWRLGGLILFLELVGVSILFLGRRLLALASSRTIFAMRQELFAQLNLLPMSFYDKQPLGRIVTRLTYDVEGLEDFFSGTLARLLSSGILLGVALLGMWLTSWRWGGLLTLAILPALVVTLTLRNQVRGLNREVAIKNSTINARLSEFLNGIGVIRAFGVETWSQKVFDGVVHDHLDASIRLNVLNAWSRPLILVLCQLPLFVLFLVGGPRVWAGTLSLGMLVTFKLLCERFSKPIAALAQEVHQVQTAFTNAERVATFLRRPSEAQTLGADGHLEAGKLHGSLRFDRVTMAYAPEAAPVLREVSFEIPAGARIGFAGRTGSGKTTTLALLARLYDYQSGEIHLDGQPLRHYRRSSLRHAIGYVSQDVVIFKGSLRENLAFGEKVSAEKIQQACSRTGLLRVFAARGLDLDSALLDQGANLSFGERQLLAITRVLIRDPRLLILDEATSNIDPGFERLVFEAIEAAMEGRTCLMIAHRLSTLRNCDRILVFREGRIVEEGSHPQLARLPGGYYASLVASGETPEALNPEPSSASNPS